MTPTIGLAMSGSLRPAAEARLRRVPGQLLIGTSGFAYPEWKGSFYPMDIRPDAMLRYYANEFSSVEINYTFRAEPSDRALARWSANTPEGFVFSLKAPRRLTHMRRLQADAEALSRFLGSVERLRSKTGAVLFQYPPDLEIDLGWLREFLALLPLGRRFAFEFRHPSWREHDVKQALGERDVAWCVADTDEDDASFERTATSFAYLRLRKTSYDDAMLTRWATEIAEALAGGGDVYCYLKHEDSGRGVGFAQRLRSLVAAV